MTSKAILNKHSLPYYWDCKMVQSSDIYQTIELISPFHLEVPYLGIYSVIHTHF